MKILIACDSFKGCCTSVQVAESVERGILRALPRAEVRKVGVADGGEGTIAALTETLGGEVVKVNVHNPLMKMSEAAYGWVQSSRAAIIEMAEASGLPLVPPGQRNPMETTTFGTGELIADALKKGCRKFIIGIGGSATNDGGMGMMQALGAAFYDKDQRLLGNGGKELLFVDRIDLSRMLPEISESEFTIICDVNNPLYGAEGAACIFAPQKGADPEMVGILDRGLRNYAEVIRKETGKDIAEIAGSGAAGGLGAAFLAFFPAALKPGIDCILDTVGFDDLLEGVDLVITGEGKIDAQTVMGKVPAGILARASRKNIPVIAIGGSVEESSILNQTGFLGVFCIQQGPVSLEKAMQEDYACRNIETTAYQLVHMLAGFTGQLKLIP